MQMRPLLRPLRATLAITFIVGCILGSAATPALAVVPPNDDRAEATVIDQLPFTDTVDNEDATNELGEPQTLECFIPRSVWYSYTPDTTGFLDANTFGSDFNTQLAVYASTGGSICAGDAAETPPQVVFEAIAGTTYFFQVGSCCNQQSTASGNMVFNLTASEGLSKLEDVAVGSATIDPQTRIVTVTGTVTCSEGLPKRVAVEVTVAQRHGQTMVTGTGSATLTCDGETSFAVVVQAVDGRFRPGKAAFEMVAYDNDVDFISEETTARIRVRP
jgi:hypothetical protein